MGWYTNYIISVILEKDDETKISDFKDWVKENVKTIEQTVKMQGHSYYEFDILGLGNLKIKEEPKKLYQQIDKLWETYFKSESLNDKIKNKIEELDKFNNPAFFPNKFQGRKILMTTNMKYGHMDNAKFFLEAIKLYFPKVIYVYAHGSAAENEFHFNSENHIEVKFERSNLTQNPNSQMNIVKYYISLLRLLYRYTRLEDT